MATSKTNKTKSAKAKGEKAGAVVAAHSRVAVGGTVFLFAVHLTDRRIEIDRHRRVARTGARRPCPADRLGDDFVELADMPERERA